MPPLARIWFDGEYASAFDDQIGIRVPCDLPINGGVDGVYLAGGVDRSKVKRLEVAVKGDVATFNLGSRIKLKLDIMPPESSQFVLPEPEPKGRVVADRKALVSVVKFALQSVGHDVTYPEFHGVTFVADGKSLLVYAGYSQVLVEGRVPLEQKAKFKQITVPEKFCQQLVGLIDDDKAQLELHNDHAMLVHPDITVFARSLGSSKVQLQLTDMVEAARGKAKTFVTVPPLDNMLARASMFPGDHLNMRLSVVKNGKNHVLKMYSEGGGVELVDMSEPIEPHDEIEVATNAKHLRSGAMLDEVAIGTDAIIFRDQDITQIVSVTAAR